MSEVAEIEVLDPEQPIAAYNPIRAGIEAMTEKYGKTVFSVATAKDLEATKEARAEVREVRYNVEKIRKALKAPALAYSKRIDDEAKEYTEAILAIEAPIDELIKAEERRKAEEKSRREAEERERALQVQRAIDDITRLVLTAVDLSADTIDGLIVQLINTEITLDQFGDRAGEAEIARQQTLEKLSQMHEAATKREAEAKRLAEERAELARQKAEQDKARAEAKAKADAEEAAQQEAIAKQRAELKAQQDAIDRQRQELADAKAAAERKEQERLDAIEAEAQAKRDAEAKAAQDKKDAEAAAAKKKADEKAAKDALRQRARFLETGPGDAEIIRTLAQHYLVDDLAVISWLSVMDLEAAAAEFEKELS